MLLLEVKDEKGAKTQLYSPARSTQTRGSSRSRASNCFYYQFLMTLLCPPPHRPSHSCAAEMPTWSSRSSQSSGVSAGGQSSHGAKRFARPTRRPGHHGPAARWLGRLEVPDSTNVDRIALHCRGRMTQGRGACIISGAGGLGFGLTRSNGKQLPLNRALYSPSLVCSLAADLGRRGLLKGLNR
jgi:hypothetical protein